LLHAELATATKELVGQRRQIEITRFKLTEAGRATLSERNAPVVPQRPVRTKQVNERARVNDGENRPTVVTEIPPSTEIPTLVAEIMSLSRPSAGRERRARHVLNNFTLNELRVLATALRGGVLNVALPWGRSAQG